MPVTTNKVFGAERWNRFDGLIPITMAPGIGLITAFASKVRRQKAP
jgi:hypothetical protein